MTDPILDDVFPPDTKAALVEADKGKRLLNYLIDAVAVGILQTVLANLFEALLFVGYPPIFEGYKVIFSFSLFSTPIYYLLAEYLFNGKTVGKWLTQTRVVRLDGNKPFFEQLLGRSFARIIPFEPFSYLGDSPNGWHDRLSKTIVIDEQKSTAFSQNDELV